MRPHKSIRVERVLRFFILLKQLIGRWAGVEFRLLDWQVRWVVAPVFGLVRDGRRVIRTLWLEIPRKNGKSTLCSGLGLYLLSADREPGAQVYAAAGSTAQAKLVFDPARRMALGSAALSKKLGKGITKTLIEHPTTGSVFRAVSSRDDLAHGLNVHGAVIDEVHVHKSPDLIDAMETGVGSREQPLVAFITTADDGTDGSIYATKREYVEGLASGVLDDDSFYGVVFGVDHEAEGFDPFSEETLRAANPGYGVTVMADYLAKKAKEAQQSPAQLNRYLRLHLNVRTKQTVRWLDLARWDATAGMVAPDDFRGRVGYGGLDLSSTSDFTAWALICPQDAGGWVVDTLVWAPEEQLAELARRTGAPLQRWADAGFLRVTEGNVVDYARVRADIAARVAELGVKVAEVAYDPWNATETALAMQDQDGHTMVATQQGYKTLSPAAKELERLVLGSTPEAPLLRHGGHPVLRWMADCVEVRQDDNGNIRPVKPDRRKSSKRIDGIAALVNAMTRGIHHQAPKRSAYEDGDLMVV